MLCGAVPLSSGPFKPQILSHIEPEFKTKISSEGEKSTWGEGRQAEGAEEVHKCPLHASALKRGRAWFPVLVLVVLLGDWCRAGKVMLDLARRALRLLAVQLMGSTSTQIQAQF